MRFLHVADIHLDSPLRELAVYEGAPVDRIRGATRHALRNMVDLAIERAVDFVIIAGDVYDGDWKNYGTGLYFAREMSRLRVADIPVFVIRGNHDAASSITRSLPLPGNVREFGTRKPETMMLADAGVALHGQSFANRSVEENLAADYPEPVAGFFNIGILHTSADGREGHDRYAPCSLTDMQNKGYDYWALGHIHKRELLSNDPPILFPGNIQGRHINEAADEGKGCTLVEVKDGRVSSMEHVPLDTVRWDRLAVDLADIEAFDEAIAAAREAMAVAHATCYGRMLAARIEFEGETALHDELASRGDDLREDVRAIANDIGGGDIWIETVRLRTTSPVGIDQLAARGDALGDIASELIAMQQDPLTIDALKAALQPIITKLPADDALADLRAIVDAPEALARLSQAAGERVLAELARSGGDEGSETR
jgi:DNA repair exonuclease SbcCD nuclease subunit